MPLDLNNRLCVGVIAPAAHGSLGDQAMLEAIRRRLSDREDIDFKILFRRDWTMTPLREDYETARFMVAGVPLLMRAQAYFLSRKFTHLWLVGADIVDGVYEKEYLLGLVTMLKSATSFGVNTGVFGASISPDADKSVMELFADSDEIKFLARDTVSSARFSEFTGRPTEIVADLGFLIEPKVTTPSAEIAQGWLHEQKTSGRKVAAVNANGFTVQEAPDRALVAQIKAYERWMREDPALSLFLFPHDFRSPPAGDEFMVEALARALQKTFPDRVFELRAPLNAWDVKALLKEADLVITGRMHAAIAALGVGRAPLCFVYQGKFEGLMQHFDLKGLCQETASLFDEGALFAMLKDYESRAGALSSQVAMRLPAVLALAEKNFEPFKPQPARR